MKFKIRFTNNKGEIEERWLTIGQPQTIVANELTGKTRLMGTIEIMEITSPALPKSDR